jgi:hypothetical protein
VALDSGDALALGANRRATSRQVRGRPMRMNWVRMLSNAFLQHDYGDFVDAASAKRVIELLLRWRAQYALGSLIGVEDLKGCSMLAPQRWR